MKSLSDYLVLDPTTGEIKGSGDMTAELDANPPAPNGILKDAWESTREATEKTVYQPVPDWKDTIE